MGRKLPFFPTCGSPSKTLSFRATTMAGNLEHAVENEDMESMIKGLTSDRFFFKPGKTSSILEEAKLKDKESELPYRESVSMMEMESTDPFLDFKKSMQEMVEADGGLKEWNNLQELLSLYLAVNDKINHGYIIGAFVDLLVVNLGSSSSSSLSSTYSSSSSSSLINGHEKSLLMESSSSNKKKMMIRSKSPESTLLFTSSAAASSSGTCSSTSHCLSSCSLEEDDDEDIHEDHNSPQKEIVSDYDVYLWKYMYITNFGNDSEIYL